MSKSENRKHMILGLSMGVVFFGVLIAMFSPIFGKGMNALEFSDQLFNTIAKGSTEYIPGLQKQVAKFDGKTFDLTLHFHSGTTEGHEGINVKADEVAAKASVLLGTVADVELMGEQLKVSGDMGRVLTAVLQDSADMFENRGQIVSDKYGMDERMVMFMWWKALKELDKELKIQGGRDNVAMAKFVDTVVKKGVEVGYNFYGIAPEKASDRAGILSFSLVFYVVYTLWWGMTIFYLFEGCGLAMSAGRKKEV
ncbi:hypothetical protein GGQ74_002515 [Desulfobaculum xiamenense]|uniref:Uncharacterized protein n=1 Tax=Desulfobaculum xiamenense TaxID=995050 RepID=A0A846QQS1_9BACT|nr:hypothetical protein [Desulfobaculum xiamenense]NJB68842.1 hypothetical protein [Desulfobaculum xiamenense]